MHLSLQSYIRNVFQDFLNYLTNLEIFSKFMGLLVGAAGLLLVAARSLACSLARSLTHSLTRSLTHSLTHSRTRSLAYSLVLSVFRTFALVTSCEDGPW